VGATGDSASHAQVNALDAGGVRDNPHNFLNPALITDAYDINRDERVDAIDYGLVRDNATNFLNDLNLITPPEAAAAPEEAAPTQVMLTTSPETTPSPTTQSVTEPVAVLSGSSVSEAQATSVVEKPTTSVVSPPVPAAIEASSADGDDADARSRGDAFSPQLRRALVAWEHQQRESGRSRRPLLPPRLERFNAAAVLGVGEAEADDGLLLEADAVAGRG